MLKKSIAVIFWMFVISIWILPFGEAKGLNPIWPTAWIEKILTTKDTDIIDPPNENAMMQGTHTAVKSEEDHQITNISNTTEVYSSHKEAEKWTLAYIQRLINWVLGMLAFVALVVVLYGWFQMVTAAGDDAKFKSWKTALKKVTIGIIGIGASWLIISFFFWIVNTMS